MMPGTSTAAIGDLASLQSQAPTMSTATFNQIPPTTAADTTRSAHLVEETAHATDQVVNLPLPSTAQMITPNNPTMPVPPHSTTTPTTSRPSQRARQSAATNLVQAMRGTCGDNEFMDHLPHCQGFTAVGCNSGGGLIDRKTSELKRSKTLAEAVDTTTIDAVCLVETHLTTNNDFSTAITNNTENSHGLTSSPSATATTAPGQSACQGTAVIHGNTMHGALISSQPLCSGRVIVNRYQTLTGDVLCLMSVYAVSNPTGKTRSNVAQQLYTIVSNEIADAKDRDDLILLYTDSNAVTDPRDRSTGNLLPYDLCSTSNILNALAQAGLADASNNISGPRPHTYRATNKSTGSDEETPGSSSRIDSWHLCPGLIEMAGGLSGVHVATARAPGDLSTDHCAITIHIDVDFQWDLNANSNTIPNPLAPIRANLNPEQTKRFTTIMTENSTPDDPANKLSAALTEFNTATAVPLTDGGTVPWTTIAEALNHINATTTLVSTATIEAWRSYSASLPSHVASPQPCVDRSVEVLQLLCPADGSELDLSTFQRRAEQACETLTSTLELTIRRTARLAKDPPTSHGIPTKKRRQPQNTPPTPEAALEHWCKTTDLTNITAAMATNAASLTAKCTINIQPPPLHTDTVQRWSTWTTNTTDATAAFIAATTIPNRSSRRRYNTNSKVQEFVSQVNSSTSSAQPFDGINVTFEPIHPTNTDPPTLDQTPCPSTHWENRPHELATEMSRRMKHVSKNRTTGTSASPICALWHTVLFNTRKHWLGHSCPTLVEVSEATARWKHHRQQLTNLQRTLLTALKGAQPGSNTDTIIDANAETVTRTTAYHFDTTTSSDAQPTITIGQATAATAEITLMMTMIDDNVEAMHFAMSPVTDNTDIDKDDLADKWRDACSPFVDEADLLSTMLEMTKNKSSTGMPVEYCSSAGPVAHAIVLELTKFYFAGHQPPNLKLGVCAPIHKNTDKARPITMLRFIHKLCAFKVAKLEGHITRDTIDDNQHGGLPARSLDEPLLLHALLTDYALFHNIPLTTCLGDCSEAFDRLLHDLMPLMYVNLGAPLFVANLTVAAMTGHTRVFRTAYGISDPTDAVHLRGGSAQGESRSGLAYTTNANVVSRYLAFVTDRRNQRSGSGTSGFSVPNDVHPPPSSMPKRSTNIPTTLPKPSGPGSISTTDLCFEHTMFMDDITTYQSSSTSPHLADAAVPLSAIGIPLNIGKGYVLSTDPAAFKSDTAITALTSDSHVNRAPVCRVPTNGTTPEPDDDGTVPQLTNPVNSTRLLGGRISAGSSQQHSNIHVNECNKTLDRTYQFLLNQALYRAPSETLPEFVQTILLSQQRIGIKHTTPDAAAIDRLIDRFTANHALHLLQLHRLTNNEQTQPPALAPMIFLSKDQLGFGVPSANDYATIETAISTLAHLSDDNIVLRPLFFKAVKETTTPGALSDDGTDACSDTSGWSPTIHRAIRRLDSVGLQIHQSTNDPPPTPADIAGAADQTLNGMDSSNFVYRAINTRESSSNPCCIRPNAPLSDVTVPEAIADGSGLHNSPWIHCTGNIYIALYYAVHNKQAQSDYSDIAVLSVNANASNSSTTATVYCDTRDPVSRACHHVDDNPKARNYAVTDREVLLLDECIPISDGTADNPSMDQPHMFSIRTCELHLPANAATMTKQELRDSLQPNVHALLARFASTAHAASQRRGPHTEARPIEINHDAGILAPDHQESLRIAERMVRQSNAATDPTPPPCPLTNHRRRIDELYSLLKASRPHSIAVVWGYWSSTASHANEPSGWYLTGLYWDSTRDQHGSTVLAEQFVSTLTPTTTDDIRIPAHNMLDSEFLTPPRATRQNPAVSNNAYHPHAAGRLLDIRTGKVQEFDLDPTTSDETLMWEFATEVPATWDTVWSTRMPFRRPTITDPNALSARAFTEMCIQYRHLGHHLFLQRCTTAGIRATMFDECLLHLSTAADPLRSPAPVQSTPNAHVNPAHPVPPPPPPTTLRTHLCAEAWSQLHAKTKSDLFLPTTATAACPCISAPNVHDTCSRDNTAVHLDTDAVQRARDDIDHGVTHVTNDQATFNKSHIMCHCGKTFRNRTAFVAHTVMTTQQGQHVQIVSQRSIAAGGSATYDPNTHTVTKVTAGPQNITSSRAPTSTDAEAREGYVAALNHVNPLPTDTAVCDSADCEALKVGVDHRRIESRVRQIVSRPNSGPITTLAAHDNTNPRPGERVWFEAEHDRDAGDTQLPVYKLNKTNDANATTAAKAALTDPHALYTAAGPQPEHVAGQFYIARTEPLLGGVKLEISELLHGSRLNSAALEQWSDGRRHNQHDHPQSHAVYLHVLNGDIDCPRTAEAIANTPPQYRDAVFRGIIDALPDSCTPSHVAKSTSHPNTTSAFIAAANVKSTSCQLCGSPIGAGQLYRHCRWICPQTQGLRTHLTNTLLSVLTHSGPCRSKPHPSIDLDELVRLPGVQRSDRTTKPSSTTTSDTVSITTNGPTGHTMSTYRLDAMRRLLAAPGVGVPSSLMTSTTIRSLLYLLRRPPNPAVMQTHPAFRRWFQRHYNLNQEANASLLTFATHVFPLPPRLASDGVDPTITPLNNHTDSPDSEPWTTSTFASVQGTPTEIRHLDLRAKRTAIAGHRTVLIIHESGDGDHPDYGTYIHDDRLTRTALAIFPPHSLFVGSDRGWLEPPPKASASPGGTVPRKKRRRTPTPHSSWYIHQPTSTIRSPVRDDPDHLQRHHHSTNSNKITVVLYEPQTGCTPPNITADDIAELAVALAQTNPTPLYSKPKSVPMWFHTPDRTTSTSLALHHQAPALLTDHYHEIGKLLWQPAPLIHLPATTATSSSAETAAATLRSTSGDYYELSQRNGTVPTFLTDHLATIGASAENIKSTCAAIVTAQGFMLSQLEDRVASTMLRGLHRLGVTSDPAITTTDPDDGHRACQCEMCDLPHHSLLNIRPAAHSHVIADRLYERVRDRLRNKIHDALHDTAERTDNLVLLDRAIDDHGVYVCPVCAAPTLITTANRQAQPTPTSHPHWTTTSPRVSKTDTTRVAHTVISRFLNKKLISNHTRSPFSTTVLTSTPDRSASRADALVGSTRTWQGATIAVHVLAVHRTSSDVHLNDTGLRVCILAGDHADHTTTATTCDHCETHPYREVEQWHPVSDQSSRKRPPSGLPDTPPKQAPAPPTASTPTRSNHRDRQITRKKSRTEQQTDDRLTHQQCPPPPERDTTSTDMLTNSETAHPDDSMEVTNLDHDKAERPKTPTTDDCVVIHMTDSERDEHDQMG